MPHKLFEYSVIVDSAEYRWIVKKAANRTCRSVTPHIQEEPSTVKRFGPEGSQVLSEDVFRLDIDRNSIRLKAGA